MGGGSYSSYDRNVRATTAGYSTKSVNDIFVQQRKSEIYAKMNPEGVAIREARDSAEHPNTVPVQLYLDVTGSMGTIPHMFIKDGLPTMVTEIIQAGIDDVALMFGAIGDHEYDSYPLQISQFESGDEELDYWLTHTYLEGGGGGNAGESYGLAWYFAANHVVTDAKDKRGEKGFLFTIGDEPILETYPARALSNIMGETVAVDESVSAEALLEEVQKTHHVFHVHINHGRSYGGRNEKGEVQWRNLLGENLIVVEDYHDIPKLIAKKVVQFYKPGAQTVLTDNSSAAEIVTETAAEADSGTIPNML